MLWAKYPSTSDSPNKRSAHTGAIVGGRWLYVFGGWDGQMELGDLHRLDLTTRQWTKVATSGPAPVSRHFHNMVVAHDRLFVFGGYDGTQWRNDTHALNLTSHVWEAVQPLHGTAPPPRASGTWHCVGGDKLLLFGGYDGESFLDDMWLLHLLPNNATSSINTSSDPSGMSSADFDDSGLSSGSNGLPRPAVASDFDVFGVLASVRPFNSPSHNAGRNNSLNDADDDDDRMGGFAASAGSRAGRGRSGSVVGGGGPNRNDGDHNSSSSSSRYNPHTGSGNHSCNSGLSYYWERLHPGKIPQGPAGHADITVASNSNSPGRNGSGAQSGTSSYEAGREAGIHWPEPRSGHAADTCGPLLFIFGGRHRNGRFNDVQVLDTTTWTPPPGPGRRCTPRARRSTTARRTPCAALACACSCSAGTTVRV